MTKADVGIRVATAALAAVGGLMGGVALLYWMTNDRASAPAIAKTIAMAVYVCAAVVAVAWMLPPWRWWVRLVISIVGQLVLWGATLGWLMWWMSGMC